MAVEYLLSQYDVDENKLRSDLEAFTEELMAKGLLEEVSAQGTG
ncbi:MAG: PqqD family protein [Chloroflexi bacterium]|nr:PqqD family protein [Chloroflexota bacterium]